MVPSAVVQNRACRRQYKARLDGTSAGPACRCAPFQRIPFPDGPSAEALGLLCPSTASSDHADRPAPSRVVPVYRAPRLPVACLRRIRPGSACRPRPCRLVQKTPPYAAPVPSGHSDPFAEQPDDANRSKMPAALSCRDFGLPGVAIGMASAGGPWQVATAVWPDAIGLASHSPRAAAEPPLSFRLRRRLFLVPRRADEARVRPADPVELD